MQHSEVVKTHFSLVSNMKEEVGQTIGVSSWFTVDQELVSEFGRVTSDEQWIHMDKERAERESPYGATIAHGFLILSLIPKFLAETISFGNAEMGINYGTDKVRFINAVKVGAMIRGVIDLMELSEMPGGYKYKCRVSILIKGDEKPACVAEMLAIVMEENMNE